MSHQTDKLRKKELTRQYKQDMPLAGVYAIRNRLNQRVFVGASMQLEGALNRHRTELRLSTHRNTALLQDWRTFGANNFTFDVLDTLAKREDPAFDYLGELAAMLDLWSEELGCFGANGYNKRPARSGGPTPRESP